MCTVCGCGQGAADPRQPGDPASPAGHDQTHTHDHGHHHHDHDHDHHHHHDQSHGPAPSAGGDEGAARLVAVERDILARNTAQAADNRLFFAGQGIVALNLVSSPGSGKTTLLAATVAALKDRVPLAVIEGDQQTDLDADRIRAAGAPALQINTGKGCHLDAAMVARAVATPDLRAALAEGGLLFIENVGNLVCPAAFDLGEAARVVILSVTEGDDKPLKYPDMFATADVMVITKTDLAPHVAFDQDRCVEAARRANPDLAVLALSATRGEGLEAWTDWILRLPARGARAT